MTVSTNSLFNKPLQIYEVIDIASNMLSNVTDRPRLEAEILLSFFLKESRVYLHINSTKIINPTTFEQLLSKRLQNIPIEYIINNVSFYSREFFIESGVLIPRPETEILVELATKEIQTNGYKRVAEIGVGSGIISIMLSILNPDIKIVATDINPKAIEVAKINAKKFNVEQQIEFIHTEYLQQNQEFDIIVSNPPYIPNGFQIDKNLEYEPQEALFGGENGDEIIKNIIDLAFEFNVKKLVVEMGFNQKKDISNYLKDKKVHFYKDLSNLDRGFILDLEQIE